MYTSSLPLHYRCWCTETFLCVLLLAIVNQLNSVTSVAGLGNYIAHMYACLYKHFLVYRCDTTNIKLKQRQEQSNM